MIRVIRGECEGGGMDHLVNLKFMKLDLHVVCHIKNHTVNRGGGGVGFGPPCKIQIYEIRFTQ